MSLGTCFEEDGQARMWPQERAWSSSGPGNISAGEKDEWRTGQLPLVLGRLGLELSGSVPYQCGGQYVKAAILAESKEKL